MLQDNNKPRLNCNHAGRNHDLRIEMRINKKTSDK